MAKRESGFNRAAKVNRMLVLGPLPLGHSSPPLCPTQCPPPEDGESLGLPLSIREVAALIGCSSWTVRQKYMPSGLPYFRLGSTGKLIFYQNQVISWLLARQQKGGSKR